MLTGLGFGRLHGEFDYSELCLGTLRWACMRTVADASRVWILASRLVRNAVAGMEMGPSMIGQGRRGQDRKEAAQ